MATILRGSDNIDSANINISNSPYVMTALNASGTTPIYACRALCNFNGSGTVSIRYSKNISSITDIGVGDFRANFTTAMPTADYYVGLTSGNGTDNFFTGYVVQSQLQQTTSIRLSSFMTVNGAGVDAPVINIAIA